MGRDRRGWRPFRKFQSRESVGPRYLWRPVRKFQSSELDEKYRVMDTKVDDHPTPELPSEIIFTHILPRLPPKFLIKQCSRVCKSWSSLIRHHSFVTAYRNFQCRKGTTNFLLRRGRRLFSSQLSQEGNLTPVTRLSTIYMNPQYRQFFWVTSLGGLLVIGSYGDDPVTIYNSSTGESIQLPHEKTDPKICPTYHIGFSPFTNEYKVLQILLDFDEKGDPNITLSIFTLGMDYSWRPLKVDVGDLPSDLQDDPFGRSVCLHGAIHWLHEENQSILVFDLGDEAFRVIPLPQEYDYTRECDVDVYLTFTYIVEVGGCLGVFVDNSGKQNIALWILKDYQNHVWVKETIPLLSTVRQYRDMNLRWRVDGFGTIGAGDDLLLEVTVFGFSPGYDDLPPQYYLYNMKSKHERTLDFTFPTGMRSVYDDREESMELITSYEDSIIPLKLHNSVTES